MIGFIFIIGTAALCLIPLIVGLFKAISGWSSSKNKEYVDGVSDIDIIDGEEVETWILPEEMRRNHAIEYGLYIAVVVAIILVACFFLAILRTME